MVASYQLLVREARKEGGATGFRPVFQFRCAVSVSVDKFSVFSNREEQAVCGASSLITNN
jgi:hypothetical protein